MKTEKAKPRARRAARGSGSVRRRSDGLWELRVRVHGERRSFYGATLGEAQASAAEAAKMELSVRSRVSPSVEAWMAEWLEMSRDRLDPQTWGAYERHARLYVVPALGNTRLSALTGSHMDRLHRYCRSRVGSSSAHHIHSTFSSALSAAARRGLITANVAKAVRAPRRADRDIRPYSPEQVGALFSAVRGLRFEALYVLAATLGPRQGELLGLRWRHVDLEAGRIRVVGNAIRALEGNRVVADPKTAASARTLSPLPAVVVDALRRMPRGGDEDLVWPAVRGKGPLRAQTLVRAWHADRERAGLPYAKFHNLRHTAATIMLDDGVPPHVVSAILGHASVGITLQLYAHVTRSGLGAATAALDARYATAS